MKFKVGDVVFTTIGRKCKIVKLVRKASSLNFPTFLGEDENGEKVWLRKKTFSGHTILIEDLNFKNV